MKTVHSEDHRLHFPQAEIEGGRLVTPFECPARVEYILRQLRAVGLDAIVPPGPYDPGAIDAVHCADYLSFLETAWDDWIAAGHTGEIIPTFLPTRRMGTKRPRAIDGRVGYHAMASDGAMTAGTWPAAQAAAAVAQTAQRIVSQGARAAFALCRPPGHHATRDQFGGYCFLNNAAIVAEMFRRDGADRVAVLDVDFHHGNGTQDIFWERGDVLFCSIHGDPAETFPYFTGHANETGAGAGDGTTLNFPLPPDTGFGPWRTALGQALARIAEFRADAVVVSLGVDTFKADPISSFRLETDDFRTFGGDIASAGKPTVFVMEGGYAVEDIGRNTVGVLQGFLDHA